MIIFITILVSLITGGIAAAIGYIVERRKGVDNVPDAWPTARAGLLGFTGVWILYALLQLYAQQRILYLWLGQNNLTSVWNTRFGTQSVLWVIGFVGAFILFTVVYYSVALLFPRVTPPETPKRDDRRRGSRSGWEEPLIDRNSEKWAWRSNLYGWASSVVRLIAAGQFAGTLGDKVNSALAAAQPVPFGKYDPIFGRDLSFYVFSLPWVDMLLNIVFWLLLVALVGAVVDFLVCQARYSDLTNTYEIEDSTWMNVRSFLSVYATLYLVLWAIYVSYERFRLLVHGNPSISIISGAGYVDTHARMFGLNIFLATLVLAAVIMIVNAVIRSLWKIPGAVAVAISGVAAVFLVISPWYQTKFEVGSQSNIKERVYIQYQIDMTRWAYALDSIKDAGVVPFKSTLSGGELRQNEPILAQSRIVDWTPLLDANQTNASVQTYYTFNDVDIDRYPDLGEVMVALRELDVKRLPGDASADWVVSHMRYTHGYGFTVAAANATGPNGSPAYLVNTMPPTGPAQLMVAQPDLYFGELTDTPAIVKTTVPEVGHPEGGVQSTVSSYDGPAGIPLGSSWNRFLFALYFNDYRYLISENIIPASRILMDRNIHVLMHNITPFLAGDADPYAVLGGDEAVWMWDMYTTSDNIPYSAHMNGLNFIRNSVKTTIGAYTGQVHVYVIDATDPVLKTWQKIYPAIFSPADKMPPNLRTHIRYAEDLFTIQANMYARYHITNPDDFYTSTGVWERAKETSAVDGTAVPADPRYIEAVIPGGTSPEFINTVYFTNAGQITLSAGMYARSDPEHYGEVIVFQFPPDESVVGLETFHTNILQNPALSQQISQWNTQGSKVYLGNIVIMPAYGQDGKLSLVHTRALYLQSVKARIPQITYVLLENGQNELFYAPTLPDALNLLFEGNVEKAPTPVNPQGDEQSLIQQLKTHSDALKACAGDWMCIGKEVQSILNLIDQLNKLNTPTGSLFYQAFFGQIGG